MAEPRWLNETQKVAWLGLIVIVNRAFPEIERSLKVDGLLAVQYGILVALADAPDHTLTLSALADTANTSQSRLTHRLRDLVASADIVVADDSDDRRIKNATLTAAGHQRLIDAAASHVETVQRVIFDLLSPKQTAELADALSRIAANQCDHKEFRK
jgi:DNA-binding MarR family transcriptional regulator